ncbi:hypothetical protein QBC42DRAFT_70499 [Cladorrhinum samala]|uniref:C2H2-type domain-containing protein n=1 Tax=Cladorrhinum samala TaxID=585594 RepID=A0AAV9HTD4_9PEZI|nr:hypothetical protein QBC42DRAFT_70499 [Cladorrhinum samala]
MKTTICDSEAAEQNPGEASLISREASTGSTSPRGGRRTAATLLAANQYNRSQSGEVVTTLRVEPPTLHCPVSRALPVSVCPVSSDLRLPHVRLAPAVQTPTRPPIGSHDGVQSPTNSSPSGSRRFQCGVPGCGQEFGSPKDLSRHEDSVHASNGDADHFRCQCGKTHARKDNHDRHARGCRLPKTSTYRCRCGRETPSVTDHLAHAGGWSSVLGCSDQ